ncbi:MAG: methyl-accepting chemotaxis protein [Planctomycetota bacterium]
MHGRGCIPIACLAIASLACAWLPIAYYGYGIRGHWQRSSQRWESANAQTEVELQRSRDQLLRNRLAHRCAANKQAIEAKLQTLAQQLRWLCADPATADAFRYLGKGFDRFGHQSGIKASEFQELRGDLGHFYDQVFAKTVRLTSGQELPEVGVPNDLSNLSVAIQAKYISQNPHSIDRKSLLDKTDCDTYYDRAHAVCHPRFRAYQQTHGLGDILLIRESTADVIYTVNKSIDFACNLQEASLLGDDLNRVFQAARALEPSDAPVFDGFKSYLADYGRQSSMVAAPVFADDDCIGVVVVRFHAEQLAPVAKSTAGRLSSETRVLSAGQPLQPTVQIVTADANTAGVDSKLAVSPRRARSSRLTKSIIGRVFGDLPAVVQEDDVAVASAKVDVPGIDLAIVSTKPSVTAHNVETAGTSQRTSVSPPGLLTPLGLATVLAVALTASVVILYTQPVRRSANELAKINQSDDPTAMRMSVEGVTGELATQFNRYAECVERSYQQIAASAGSLCRAGEELESHSSVPMPKASGDDWDEPCDPTVELKESLRDVSGNTTKLDQIVRSMVTTIDQMRSTVSEIADNAKQSAGATGSAAAAAEDSSAKIRELNDAAKEIGGVLEVIQDIAEQTNLLALNATIEAARAGEAGKGFAVVATEVKQLATQTAAATEDIGKRIEAIQRSTNVANHSIDQIGGIVRKADQLTAAITAAVEQQDSHGQQISEEIHAAATASQSVADSVDRSITIAADLARPARKDGTGDPAADTPSDFEADSAREILRLAADIQSFVHQSHVQASDDRNGETGRGRPRGSGNTVMGSSGQNQ